MMLLLSDVDEGNHLL